MAYFGCINKSTSPPTPPEPDYLYKWDFTKSLVDEVQGEVFELFLGSTQDNNGIHFTGNNQGALWENGADLRGKTLEIVMGDVDFKGTISSTDIGFISTPLKTSNFPTSTGGRLLAPLIYKGNTGWGLYGSSSGYDSTNGLGYSLFTETGNLQGSTTAVFNYFSNKTIKFVFNNDGSQTDLYIDNIFEGSAINRWCLNNFKQLSFGNGSIKGSDCYRTGFQEARFFDMTIKAVKIYENEEE